METLLSKNKSGLCLSLGMRNVYRRLEESFVHEAGSLNERNGTKAQARERFHCRDTNTAFLRVIQRLPPSARPHTFLKLGLSYSVSPDASKYSLGYSSRQTTSAKNQHTLGYWSQSSISPEQNYSASEGTHLSETLAFKNLSFCLFY